MNIIHFMLGVILYSTFNLAVLSEAPTLKKIDTGEFIHGAYQTRILFGIIIFALGSSFQHYSHRMFAALRKDKAGNLKSTAHVLPSGGAFEYISNPHYLGEIIIYSGFVCILGLNHCAGISIWIFVFINQIIAGLLNHNWYQEKFKNFPKARKAIIPFLL
ncbi:DgyrCDS6004 [Dimorphilus gyrociliatus]|uniref:Polyprenal reductase n=1 Tax=Dimorphilus gyrociliatus TaxID=2664684 RepID=A0A7I8VNA1_9ANNE|nr:DgyrCDS6004 [Dimorphilus gyrociliatus]